MIQVFLSYSRTDGLEAAARLRGELTGMGFSIWRDIEEMRGGLAWRKQLFQALSQVDAVLVLLTPGAVASANVTREWQNALMMDKRVIPLLASPCDVPADLKALHYHRLDDPAGYILGLARLARDLIALAVKDKGDAAMDKAGDVITVIGSGNAVAARESTVILQSGGASMDSADIARILAALREQPVDGLSAAQMAQLRAILVGLEQQVQGVAQGIDDLKAGQQRILARFDLTEQRIISPILARLDAHHVTELTKLLDVLDATAFAAGDLECHLAAIDAALAEIDARSAEIADRQLVASAQQVAELAGAPGLDAKHKLKVTLPIVPLLVAYEAELELSSRLDLAAAWQALRNLLRRSPKDDFGSEAPDRV